MEKCIARSNNPMAFYMILGYCLEKMPGWGAGGGQEAGGGGRFAKAYGDYTCSETTFSSLTNWPTDWLGSGFKGWNRE